MVSGKDCVLCRRAWVRSLVRKLESLKPHGTAKKKPFLIKKKFFKVHVTLGKVVSGVFFEIVQDKIEGDADSAEWEG